MNSTDLIAPNKSRAIGFSTDEPNKFEGWHNENLLMIFDEAKSIPEGIWHAAERCQPTAWLAMSSTGGIDSRFAQLFLSPKSKWEKHSITSYDCEHLSKTSWIQDQIDEYGVDHPLVRSMIFSEFISEGDGATVLTLEKLRKLRDANVRPMTSEPYAFIDWGGGGDETVIAIRRGNQVQMPIAWSSANTMATVGRAINELKSAGVKADNGWADDGGLGKPMNDRMREMGWPIKRLNFGGKAYSDRYVNRGSEIWWETARQIERAELILPQDELMDAQLCSRKAKITSSGKMGLESKDEMKRRGVSSPDRGDAVCGVCCVRNDLGELTRFDSGNTGSDWLSEMQEASDGESSISGFDSGG